MHGHVWGPVARRRPDWPDLRVPTARRPRTRRLAALLGALAVPLVLTGCGSTPGTDTASAAGATGAAAAQYAANTPPAAARMVCSEEIRGEVADALNVPSVPAPTPAWADHVYTCAYAPSMGRLVLAVTVTDSGTAARGQLETLRGRLPGAAAEPGLGEEAFGSPAGTVVSRKDNLVLTVDATGLPDDLGNTHESRLELARVITAGVFNCWTGSS